MSGINRMDECHNKQTNREKMSTKLTERAERTNIFLVEFVDFVVFIMAERDSGMPGYFDA